MRSLSAFVINHSHVASSGHCNIVSCSCGSSCNVNNFADMLSFPTVSLALSDATETKTFDAVPPDTSILFGFGLVLVLSVVASIVWAQDVVPVSRTKLALSKRDGEVKEYLDDLRQGYLNSTDVEIDPKGVQVRPNVGDGRDFERWMFSDWLNNNKSAGKGRKKEPAIPILKKAKWNSGDNPVLVTAALMMIGIVFASITERVGTLGSP